MSAHVLLNLLNKLGKEIKCEACRKSKKISMFECNELVEN